MNELKNVLRIASTDASSLGSELQDRMIGMETTNGFLGAKEPGGELHYYAPQGSDSNYNSVTVNKTTPTNNNELASKLYVDYKITEVNSFDSELVDGNGVRSGMEISIGTPNSTFSISAGTYHVIGESDDVVYPGVENVTLTYLADINQTYIAIETATGNVIQGGYPFTPAHRRLVVILGVVVHTNNTSVNAINNLPDVASYTLAQLNDFMDGLNAFNIDGNVISAKGANLQIKKSYGEIFKRGSNFQTEGANDPHTKSMNSLDPVTNLRMRQYNGDEGSDTNVIDLRWEDNGVLKNLSSNRWGVYRVVLFPSNLIRIQYPQYQYQSLVEAQNAIQTESYIVENNMKQNGLLRGFIIIKQGTTALNNASNAKFIEADKFGYNIAGGAGGGVTTLQGAYNNSAEPEILTDDIRQALTIKRGSLADTDPVLEIKNGAGTTTAYIQGDGYISTDNTIRVRDAGELAEGVFIENDNIKIISTADQIMAELKHTGGTNGELTLWSQHNQCYIKAELEALNISTGGGKGVKIDRPHTTNSINDIATDINPKVLISREYLDATVTTVTAQGVIGTIQTTNGLGAFVASNASIFTEGVNTHLYLGHVDSNNGIIDGNGSLVMVVDNDEISTTDGFYVRSRDVDAGVTVFQVIQNENTSTGGVPEAPQSSNAKIDNVGAKALITKEYLDAKVINIKTIFVENPVDGEYFPIFQNLTGATITIQEISGTKSATGDMDVRLFRGTIFAYVSGTALDAINLTLTGTSTTYRTPVSSNTVADNEWIFLYIQGGTNSTCSVNVRYTIG